MLTNRKFYIAGFIVSLFLAGVVSFYASSSPDGLEKVAQDIGFIDTAKDHTNADGTLTAQEADALHVTHVLSFPVARSA